MRETFLPFSRPDIGQEEIDAVNSVLRSGWITTGPQAARFEQQLAGYCGARESVALTSATGAMHLLLAALGIGPGDEVITPSMTWVSTVNLIVLAGAMPVFADVDRDTLMVTPDTVAACISERTRLIIPVHFAGAPVDLRPLRQMADTHQVPLVEDAAHAIGTEYRGARIGQSGTSIFSFHPIKNLTTGEGGALLSDDVKLLDRVRRLKFHGLGVNAFDRQAQGRAPQAEVLEPGFKYNLTDISAAIGLEQLKKLDHFIARRTELAHYYRERLSEIDEILPLGNVPYPSRHAWHLFIVRLLPNRAGLDRNQFMAALKAKNIGTGLHFYAAHSQKYYRETLKLSPGALPQTEWNSARICSLPLFTQMTREDVDDVVAAIKEVLTS
jgi:UDP-4-amino-4-deoxy-L-arabinose-oxoglutarate aminotransferase